MASFNTDNPDRLIYENEFLNIEVLGGVRLEGLDRMRVTLKVALLGTEIPPVRHNLDLYNDTQLEKMIRKVAERLEIGTSTTAGTMAELTQCLENYRLGKLNEQQQEHIFQSKPLTEQQRIEAIQYLKRDNLLQVTIDDLQASGIIGEGENALILYLAMTSRKMQEPISVVCLAKSGLGKSYLMERVAKCIPEEDQKEHTQLTGNAFYYYKREEIRNKVFLIEDLAGAINALFPIRELQSKKRISKTITRKGRDGKLETVTLIVEGPVSVIAMTTQESIYEDNANRSVLIYLDDSKEQDDRIMQYHKNKRAGIIDSHQEERIQQQLQRVQKVLEPVTVINPYAPMIDLPDSFPKKRRALPILLNFIEVIAFYHQYQREQKTDADTGEVYIACSPEDVQNGFRYLKNVLFRRSDELSGAVRDFYEKLKQVTEAKQLPKFRISEIRKEMNLAPRTIYHYMKWLLEYDYVRLATTKQRTASVYELTGATSRSELLHNIDQHTQAIMKQIGEPQSKRSRKQNNSN